MAVDWGIVATIVAPLLALVVGAWLNRWLEARPNVISYLANASALRVNPPDQPSIPVHSHTIVLRNAGRKPAHNVRLGHTYLPDFTVYPDTRYEIGDLPNGGKELVIPLLVPEKQVTISYLYFPPVTWNQINTHVESDEGPVKILTVFPRPQQPRWLINVMRTLVFVGATATLYLGYLGIRWLVIEVL